MKPYQRTKGQKGATLITCLVLITACLLFSQVGVESLVLEFRSKANYLQKNESLNAAENTLTQIKTELDALKKAPPFQPYCSHLACINIFRIISEQELIDRAWWQRAAVCLTSHKPGEANYAFIQPAFTAKTPDKVPSKLYIEVWVMSYNTQNQSRVILKAVFLKRFDPKELIAYPASRVAWQQFR
jgi:hypothetical protein